MLARDLQLTTPGPWDLLASGRAGLDGVLGPKTQDLLASAASSCAPGPPS